VDFTVKRGESACDESMLTGESVPVPKLAEDVAYAGTVNGWGVLDGVVLRPAGDSALQRVIRLIQHAQHLKAPSQRFSERFGSGYTLFVLGAAATVFFVWWLGLGAAPFRGTETTPSAFYRAMTLMVVLSPCALVLSVPASVLSAIARGARSGVLFRGGAALESLADVGVMAMDKTGTLTFGKLTVTGLLTINGSAETAWTAAASLAHVSSHPASRSIARHAVASGIAAEALEAAENFPGHGLRGLWRGGLAALGRREFIAGFLPPFVRQQMPPALDGRSEVWVYAEGVLARIELSDAIRPEARTLVARLQNDGIRVVMLTGDKSSAANAMAKEAGVDEVRAELRPEGKVEAIQRMKASGCRVAMVGDGVNDAPCLAAADVGVAMGAHGSDAAIEQAEVVLMHDGLEGLLFARDLSKKAQGVIRQNLLFALGIIVFMGIATLVSHRVPLFLGVLAHEGSTVLVVLNSLRLLAFRPATV
jgi:Cd2+/Zn2+-exporting ATPase